MVEVISEQAFAFQMEQKEHSRWKEWQDQSTAEWKYMVSGVVARAQEQGVTWERGVPQSEGRGPWLLDQKTQTESGGSQFEHGPREGLNGAWRLRSAIHSGRQVSWASDKTSSECPLSTWGGLSNEQCEAWGWSYRETWDLEIPLGSNHKLFQLRVDGKKRLTQERRQEKDRWLQHSCLLL